MKNETMSEKAYNLIKERLVNAENDTILSIRQMAAELEMSSTPVREAFLRLREEGLLDLVPNMGFFVTRIDVREILKTFQVRECLELFVLRKVFNNITEEHIKILEECNENQVLSLQTANIREYISQDEKFHEVFIDLYDNQYISKLYRNVREQYLVCSNKIADTHTKDAIEEHVKLIQHIRNKDIEKAVATLDLHIENAKQRLKEGYIRVMD